MKAQTPGIIRHYPALSGIITHFPSFPRNKTYRTRRGVAFLTALAIGAAPALFAPVAQAEEVCSDTLNACIGDGSAVVPAGVTVTNVYGGPDAPWGGTVTNYSVTVYGSVRAGATGGIATGGTATYNTVTISGGSANYVYGGRATGGTASHNTVIISGGSVGDATGGLASNGGTASDNTVIISGGSVSEKVAGGYTDGSSGKATNNTVRISGTPTFSSTTEIYGGESYGIHSDITTGNTLEILSSGISVAGVENFAALAFILPANNTGGAMLSVSGHADFPTTSTEVDISVFGAPALNANDTFTLIDANSLTITPTLTSGSASYFTVDKDSTGKKLIATVLPAFAALPAHAVYGSTPQGGEVTCDQPKVTEGIGATTCTATASAIAAAGATFDPDSMTVSSGTGKLINCSENTCTLTGVTSEVTVTATFTLNEYSVSDATPTGAGGTMDCPTTKVTMLDKPTCTANPETGYVFTGASAKYGDSSAANISCDTVKKECTLSGVVGDVTVEGVFKKEDYNIDDITDRAKGRVSCDPDPVQYGDSTYCTAFPVKGYVFDGTMNVTGKAALGTCDANGCWLTNVTGAATVEGHFSKEEYSITDDTDPTKGSVTCTPDPVQYDESTRCTAFPVKGYVFDGTMSVTGATLGACDATGCELTNATGPLTVTVTGQFSKEKFAITDASDPAEGSITCTPNPVPYGETVTCTATPAPGYELSGVSSSGGVSWTCDPEALTCTSSAITSALSVSATFTQPQPQPQQPYVISDTPTMGEVGLLLSGLALAGAAAPALRRREKQGKKADTRQ